MENEYTNFFNDLPDCDAKTPAENRVGANPSVAPIIYSARIAGVHRLCAISVGFKKNQ